MGQGQVEPRPEGLASENRADVALAQRFRAIRHAEGMGREVNHHGQPETRAGRGHFRLEQRVEGVGDGHVKQKCSECPRSW